MNPQLYPNLVTVTKRLSSDGGEIEKEAATNYEVSIGN